ncbi:NAD(P)-dependent dehydrogenase (short-subunit alcohol dehydrogenase family) [Nocardioides sp. BE266]|nr:NAD(P)-dependent dehydrogenase (short-subunit alcohol dehydrogenase family) [Nocardioides sp. BE266]
MVAFDRDLASAEATVASIEAEGGEALAVAGDVTQPADCRRGVQAATDRWGRLDVLHNNVGILRRGGILDQSLEDWNLVLQTNLTGVFLACQAAIPAMIESGGGSIVNVSSAAGLRYVGVPYVAYSASKAAVLHITATTAVEQATNGVRVNAVVPGLIDTPMAMGSLRGAYGDEDVKQLKQIRAEQVPMGRMGDPWDVANAALFLASDEAAYVTGTHIIVDGGLTSKC